MNWRMLYSKRPNLAPRPVACSEKSPILPSFGIEKAFQPIIKAQLEIVQYLKDHPEVTAKNIPMVRSERVEEVFNSVMGMYGQWWQRTVYDHLGDIRNRQKPDAPFAREQDLFGPID